MQRFTAIQVATAVRRARLCREATVRISAADVRVRDRGEEEEASRSWWERSEGQSPAILAVPSALFYADTREPEATDTDRLAGWSEWRGRRWPVLFRNNDSEDDLEMDGGGWYNFGETQLACQNASRPVHTGLLAQNEVCIMSPFKAQVRCLRKTIREKRYGSLWAIDIGPTEAF